MKIWLCVASMLLCIQAARAQAPEDSPPYPQTGPGHAQLAVLEAGASDFMLHSPIENCYYDPTKPWMKTQFEIAIMTAKALQALYPQFQTNPRSDSRLVHQRLQHSPAMSTALYHLLQEFAPALHEFGFKPYDIARVQKELLAQGAKTNQQYTNIPLGDAAYDDVKLLRRAGLIPFHHGQRNFDDGHVMSRYEFAVATARIIAEAYRQNERWAKLSATERAKWPLPKNNLLSKTTPEIRAALARLIERLAPELEELGFEPKHLALARRELEAGRTLILLKGKPTPAFNDVTPTHWAFNAVEQLRLNGIVIGIKQSDKP